jgi:hypothetical protein
MVDLGGQELGHGPPSPAAPWTPAAWPATYRNSSQRESTSSHQSGQNHKSNLKFFVGTGKSLLEKKREMWNVFRGSLI